MAIPKFNSFRRYTPPTCTLEIYHPQPFWGRWRTHSFPPLFSFQLHFDDPRLAKDDQISIIGDRNLLEKLRSKLQAYINRYLQQTTITTQQLSCERLTATEENNIIHFSRQSDYSHLLYYQSFLPHPEVIEVVLNNSQLLDLINALEAYHWDATQVKAIPPQKPISARLTIAVLALVGTVGVFGWWQYQQNDNLVTQEDNSVATSENSAEKLPVVIPPSPLNSKVIPETIEPQIPSELAQQRSLAPPPIAAQTPNRSNSNIVSDNSQQATSSSSRLTITPNDSKPQENQSHSATETKANLSAAFLNSLPVLSSHNDQQLALSSPYLPGDLSGNSFNNTNRIKGNSPFNAEERFPPLQSAKTVSRNISQEVKQYFQGKWQVPENLTQSIEYRLKIAENGSLSKVTPVGQVAAIFLDQTPIPVNEEIIASSFTDTELTYLTVRLILSPNGVVQTFAESTGQQ